MKAHLQRAEAGFPLPEQQTGMYVSSALLAAAAAAALLMRSGAHSAAPRGLCILLSSTSYAFLAPNSNPGAPCSSRGCAGARCPPGLDA